MIRIHTVHYKVNSVKIMVDTCPMKFVIHHIQLCASKFPWMMNEKYRFIVYFSIVRMMKIGHGIRYKQINVLLRKIIRNSMIIGAIIESWIIGPRFVRIHEEYVKIIEGVFKEGVNDTLKYFVLICDRIGSKPIIIDTKPFEAM